MDVAFLFLLIVGLMLIGVPIAVSLGLSSILFLLLFSDTSLASIAQQLFNAFAGHYTLLAIPFFILASTFMSTGGVADRIIRFAIASVGHFKGGLAIASAGSVPGGRARGSEKSWAMGGKVEHLSHSRRVGEREAHGAVGAWMRSSTRRLIDRSIHAS